MCCEGILFLHTGIFYYKVKYWVMYACERVDHQAPNPNNYGRALLNALPQAIAPNSHTNLLNVYIQLANKMGFR
jgi:hypothetical protein